ncbi:thioredoxin family protein [Flavobacterium sp.]|uniref:thioredoxin family protein n=1 Tax=Flavobacterium sp. TaxID=239 RepID=UPI002619E417|nr:thioredoxin family protein [Flavobacterium sp.]
MKIKFISFFLFFSLCLSAQEAYKLNFEQSLEKGKTENKNILLFFSGSDWCAPCIKFKKHFIETEQFKTFGSENLVIYNADFPRLKKNKLAEKITQENEILADKYNNKGLFPLILLLNSKGEILKKWEQYPTETLDEFIIKLKG